MKESLFDRDDQHGFREAAIHGMGFQECRSGHEPRPPVHAQRIVQPGNQEQQPDPARLQHVSEAVDPIVARAIGDDEGRVVGHTDEARRVAAWTGVHFARSIDARQHQERRERDEPATMPVEAVEDLPHRQWMHRAEMVPQFRVIVDAAHRLSLSKSQFEFAPRLSCESA